MANLTKIQLTASLLFMIFTSVYAGGKGKGNDNIILRENDIIMSGNKGMTGIVIAENKHHHHDMHHHGGYHGHHEFGHHGMMGDHGHQHHHYPEYHEKQPIIIVENNKGKGKGKGKGNKGKGKGKGYNMMGNEHMMYGMHGMY